MSEFTGGYPFELLPMEKIIMDCWERYWVPGTDAQYDYKLKTTTVIDSKPKILVDLDEAISYGEQQGSLIVVHKTIKKVPDLPGECSFDDFSQLGYRVIWEVPYEEWAFNELIYIYNFFLLFPGKYFLYMQMEDKYYLCAEPKEHSGKQYRFFSDERTIWWGHNGLVRFRDLDMRNPPIPVENILGLYLTTLRNLPVVLPVDYFSGVSTDYYFYADTSFMRWEIRDMRSTIHGSEPIDFLLESLKATIVWFDGYSNKLFKHPSGIFNPDIIDHQVFLHFKDWDGENKVVSVYSLMPKRYTADGYTGPLYECGDKPEGGNDMQ